MDTPHPRRPIEMPVPAHVCPKCTLEDPCFFTEGEIVSLRNEPLSEPTPWTGMVLDVERDQEGKVYRVLWGAPPARAGMPETYAARHSGAHRREELQRFLVPLIESISEMRGGGGAQVPPPRPVSRPHPFSIRIPLRGLPW